MTKDVLDLWNLDCAYLSNKTIIYRKNQGLVISHKDNFVLLDLVPTYYVHSLNIPWEYETSIYLKISSYQIYDCIQNVLC